MTPTVYFVQSATKIENGKVEAVTFPTNPLSSDPVQCFGAAFVRLEDYHKIVDELDDLKDSLAHDAF